MIKIISDKKSLFDNNKYVASEEEKEAVRIIADVVKKKPTELLALLNTYGADVRAGILPKHLISAATDALMQGNEKFNYELATLAYDPRYSNQDGNEGKAQAWIGGATQLLSSFFSMLGRRGDRQAQQEQVDSLVWQEMIRAKQQKQKVKSQTTLVFTVILGIIAILAIIIIFKPFKN